MQPTPYPIDIVLFPRATLILLAAVVEPLRAANRIAGQTLYQWRLMSPNGQPVTTTAGIPIPVDGAFENSLSESPLFVVSSYNWQDHNTPQMRTALARAMRLRPLVVGVESGTWLMAEAGLLDGYKATIHWEDHDSFSNRFPTIEIVTDRYVMDRKRWTSGGALPTMDMVLEMIRQRQGYSIALEVSRSFLYERDPRVRELLPPSSVSFGALDQRLLQAITIMEHSVSAPLDIEAVAARVHISARHLQNLFHKAFSVSPQTHYLALRLNAARRRVMETTDELAEIGAHCGFGSASAFSRAYRSQFGESASDTRRRLAPPRRGGG